VSPAGRWFWFLAPLLLVYAIVGAAITALADGNELVGIVGGLAGVAGYLAFWRWRWRQVVRRRPKDERWLRELDERYPGFARKRGDDQGDDEYARRS
jgi:uncharacterized membrane protein YfcA